MKKTKIMERRNFFKGIASIIAGIVITPFVIEAKETPQVDKPEFRVTIRNNNELRNWENDIPDSWHNRGGWNCHNQFEFGAPKDGRMVLFTADGDAYESKDIILK